MNTKLVIFLKLLFFFLLLNFNSCKNKSEEKVYKMVFSNYSSERMIRMPNVLIASNITFKLNGVKVKTKLIRIDKKNRSFKSFVDGILQVNKVIVFVHKDEIYSEIVKYSANKIEKKEDKIHLKGKAQVEERGDFIEAEEIIIIIKK